MRDEKGRRRLHGAFTGGFSAGYFNSVGSKEGASRVSRLWLCETDDRLGWTPQNFISSRSDRASRKQARPEDFMDEEDLAEMRDAQKLVDTSEEMDLTGGTQAELNRRLGDDAKECVLSMSSTQGVTDSTSARLRAL